jgi:hypothetical protein
MNPQEIKSLQRLKDWKKVIEEWKASGMGLTSWCKQTNRSFYQVRYWMRKFKQPVLNQESFVEIKDNSSYSGDIRIQIGNTQIFVEQGFDAVILKQIVQTLGGI